MQSVNSCRISVYLTKLIYSCMSLRCQFEFSSSHNIEKWEKWIESFMKFEYVDAWNFMMCFQNSNLDWSIWISMNVSTDHQYMPRRKYFCPPTVRKRHFLTQCPLWSALFCILGFFHFQSVAASFLLQYSVYWRNNSIRCVSSGSLSVIQNPSTPADIN